MARIGFTFTNAVVASPTAAVETVIATLGPISPVTDGAPLLLQFWFSFTMGTTGTGYQVKIRQGSGITGALVLSSFNNITLAATGNANPSGAAIDTAAGAEQLYSLTLTCAAATATSTVAAVIFTAICP